MQPFLLTYQGHVEFSSRWGMAGIGPGHSLPHSLQEDFFVNSEPTPPSMESFWARSHPDGSLRCASRSRRQFLCRDTSSRRRCWWVCEAGWPLKRRTAKTSNVAALAQQELSSSVQTSQKSLSKGPYRAGVRQVELSNLDRSFRTRRPYAGRSLLSFVHISARHDHPSSCQVKD